MASDPKNSPPTSQRLSYWPGLIEHYRRFLPVTDSTPIVTLNEGNTPLIEAPEIADRLGLNVKVYFKFEGANPTGSFKDRGMTVAISKALGEGARAVICASTGNTAASAAAYAGRAGLKAYVLIPKGAVAVGKLSQSVMHGARVLEVIGNFDICLKVVRDLAERDPVKIRLVNSVNPDRIAGQKTAAFEICDQLGDAPTHHFLPVGNAGNITAYWAGYQEYKSVGLSTRLPKMMGYQAAEPASAASVAGLLKYASTGLLKPGSTVVCTLTGHGLKDPDTALKNLSNTIVVEPDIEKVLKVLER